MGFIVILELHGGVPRKIFTLNCLNRSSPKQRLFGEVLTMLFLVAHGHGAGLTWAGLGCVGQGWAGLGRSGWLVGG